MKGIYRALSLLCLFASLVSFVILLCCDARQDFRFDARHLRMGSFPFIFIGISFICYQLSLQRPWRQRIKGLLLGLAFALWGSEQFLHANIWLTMLDNFVIGIFIVDLGLIVGGSLLKAQKPQNQTRRCH
jgi:hypothetical protein